VSPRTVQTYAQDWALFTDLVRRHRQHAHASIDG